ncbi:MAG TPA: CbrC family protein [Mycobacteriales bacterium]|nr:CbrC family protein [Mycobacteriales bacterium]
MTDDVSRGRADQSAAQRGGRRKRGGRSLGRLVRRRRWPQPYWTHRLATPVRVTVRFTRGSLGLRLACLGASMQVDDQRIECSGEWSEPYDAWPLDATEHVVTMVPETPLAELRVTGLSGYATGRSGPGRAGRLYAEGGGEGVTLRWGSGRHAPAQAEAELSVVRLGHDNLRPEPPEPERVVADELGGPSPTDPPTPAERALLPAFGYFPDPYGSHAVLRDPRPCAICGTARGWRYAGHLYTDSPSVAEALHSGQLVLCPWCLADGWVAQRYGALNDVTGSPAAGLDLPDVTAELTRRTPSVPPVAAASWPVCHGEACLFSGRVAPPYQFDCRQCDREITLD